MSSYVFAFPLHRLFAEKCEDKCAQNGHYCVGNGKTKQFSQLLFKIADSFDENYFSCLENEFKRIQQNTRYSPHLPGVKVRERT